MNHSHDETDTATSPNSSSETDVAESEKIKLEANELFKEKHYDKAYKLYTRAIGLNPSNPVLYTNRAACSIRLEKMEDACQDATKAIELDRQCTKAYYRRAEANFLQQHYKKALDDFRAAAKLAPKDPLIRQRKTLAEKLYKTQEFEKALRTPDEQQEEVTVVLDNFHVPDTYDGPRMDGNETEGYHLTRRFVLEMLDWQKAEKNIHRRFAFQIILEVKEILKNTPTLVDVEIPDGQTITVCGDVHGQYYDLLNIWNINGLPSEDNPYLFNGDFVDRGSFSVEVILALFAFKALYPDHIFLARGNHETRNMNKMYGFEGEVKKKYTEQMANLFSEVFCWLPLAHVLNGKVLVVHGGLFAQDGVRLDDIRAIDRNKEPPEDGLMCEVLWSDPQAAEGRSPSKRGVGVQFGPDVTRRFLQDNSLNLLVRSHEVKEEGYEAEHGGYCITCFSAPNYCDSMGNKGAFIRFTAPEMVPQFTTFTAVDHPNVRPMAYANSLMATLLGLT